MEITHCQVTSGTLVTLRINGLVINDDDGDVDDTKGTLA